MILLLWTETLRGAREWMGFAIIAGLSAALVTIALTGSSTASALGGETGAVLRSMTTPLAVLVLLACLGTTNVIAHLTISLRRRVHALWQVVGLLPRQVRTVLVGQTDVVSLCGSVVGAIAGSLLAPTAFDLVYRVNSSMTSPQIAFDLLSCLWSAGLVVVASVVGSVGGARQATRISLTLAVARPPERPSRIRAGQFVGVIASAVAAAGLVLGITVSEHALLSDAIEIGIPLSFLLTIALVLLTMSLASFVFPLAISMWTKLVPERIAVSWFLARNASRFRITRGTAAIVPLTIAVSIATSILSAFETSEAAQRVEGSLGADSTTINLPSIFSVLAGPLLICVVGAAVAIVIGAKDRGHEFSLLVVAGATRAQMLLSTLWEALIYAITAGLVGLLIAGVSNSVLAASYSRTTTGAHPVVDFGCAAWITATGAIVIASTLFPAAVRFSGQSGVSTLSTD